MDIKKELEQLRLELLKYGELDKDWFFRKSHVDGLLELVRKQYRDYYSLRKRVKVDGILKMIEQLEKKLAVMENQGFLSEHNPQDVIIVNQLINGISSESKKAIDELVAMDGMAADGYNAEKGFDPERRKFLKAAGKGALAAGAAYAGFSFIDKIAGFFGKKDAGNAYAGGNPEQTIDESEYKEITPEELGLRFEYGPATRERKHSDKPIKNQDTFFYDVRIINNSNTTYIIDTLIIDTPLNKNNIKSEMLVKAWGNNNVNLGDKLIQPDRSAYIFGKINWPIPVKDVYLLRDKNGNKYKITSQQTIP